MNDFLLSVGAGISRFFNNIRFLDEPAFLCLAVLLLLVFVLSILKKG